MERPDVNAQKNPIAKLLALAIGEVDPKYWASLTFDYSGETPLEIAPPVENSLVEIADQGGAIEDQLERIADASEGGGGPEQKDVDRLAHFLAWGVFYPEMTINSKHPLGRVLVPNYETLRDVAKPGTELDYAAQELMENVLAVDKNFDMTLEFATLLVVESRAVVADQPVKGRPTRKKK